MCADFEEADDQVRMNTEEWDKHTLAEREAMVAQALIEPHGDASDGFIDLPARDAAMKFIAHSWADISWLLEQIE